MAEHTVRVNEDIRSPKVRTIDGEGRQIGIVSIKEALELAQKQGLDLVEVAPNSEPPVCRIMDYGKYRYEQTKKVKEAKKKQQTFKVKEIKIRPAIELHDYETKLKHSQTFLEKGYKLKITLVFQGRELAHKDIGISTLEKFIEDLKDYGAVEMRPKELGRMVVTVIGPVKSK